MIRRRRVAAALLLTVVGTTSVARAAKNVPASVALLARQSCAAPVTGTAGPWLASGQSLAAAVAWTEGSPDACLVVVRIGATKPRVVAKRAIPAGYSERYDEHSSPGVRSEVLRFPDGTLAFVIDRTAMNASGGGGSETTIWRIKGRVLTDVFSAVLDGAQTISEAVESPCPSTPTPRLSSKGGTVTLHVVACANGVSTPQSLQFDGTRFR